MCLIAAIVPREPTSRRPQLLPRPRPTATSGFHAMQFTTTRGNCAAPLAALDRVVRFTGFVQDLLETDWNGFQVGAQSIEVVGRRVGEQAVFGRPSARRRTLGT
jgi:hypothetical protein